MFSLTKSLLVPVMLVFALTAPAALADEDHDHKHDTKVADNYSAAVGQIHHALAKIKQLVESGKLKQVHGDADAIVAVCKALPELALKEGSGVPKEAVKEVNLASKELAKAADAAHSASDKGNLEETKKAHALMLPLFEKIKKHAKAHGKDEHDHEHKK